MYLLVSILFGCRLCFIVTIYYFHSLLSLVWWPLFCGAADCFFEFSVNCLLLALFIGWHF